MKTGGKIFFTILAGLLLFSACSTRKDTFVNRNWHALNTKYNVLYNGNLAFEEGRESLNESYRDNYWEILPVERLEVTEEIKLDSEDNNPNFVIAEEKATKAIQKHSMDIKDEERNPQTDEAFLLLGKSRYFDQRYIPAMEAFNYILHKYTYSDKLNEATIWREKTNIRLENNELALRNLKRLLRQEELRDQEYADARAVMAQAYINLNISDSAAQNLKVAAAYTGKNEEKGRYFYIIGQLFNQMGYADSANIAFDKVIELNRKSPRVYMINAHLQKIQNTPLDDGNRELLLEELNELAANRENRPFLDKIYRELGEYHRNQGHDSLAISYYNKSLRATDGVPQLNAYNYESLASWYFDNNDYGIAGAYYDSVLTNLPSNSRQFRAVQKKRDNLEDVVTYEATVRYTDSVSSLYHMPESDRIAYFEDYIADLKGKAEADEKAERDRANAGFAAFAQSSGGKENKGKFYFYNITSLGYGKEEFRRQWGDRQLEDDWRWSSKNRISAADVVAGGELAAANADETLTEEEMYSVDFYLAGIPTDQAVIDSLNRERNFANYQLGLIYKEKFKEPLLAASKLEAVLAGNPQQRLILPAKYNLYKIYEETGSPLAEQMKQNIISNHPDSRYTEILLNPRAILSGDTDSPEAIYASLFKQFEEQQYLQVITGAEAQIRNFTGDPIVPKFELLKANAIGRLQGFREYRDALNYVALNYPNSREGKKAQMIVEEQLPQLEPSEFLMGEGGSWKVVFPFKRIRMDAATALKERLQASIKDLNYRNKVSTDIYNLEEVFVVVHGFPSRDFALGYVELLKINRDYRIDIENFVILSANYKIIQVHKNLDDYINQNVTPKP